MKEKERFIPRIHTVFLIPIKKNIISEFTKRAKDIVGQQNFFLMKKNKSSCCGEQ